MVTGGSGFIGRALIESLIDDAYLVSCPLRTDLVKLPVNTFKHHISNIDSSTDWMPSLEDCSVVVHLAGRVHVMHELSGDPLEAYRMVNVEGTRNLALQAAASGVKRFVYLSSVKSCAEASMIGCPLTHDSPASPVDAYGVSKMEAENVLHEISKKTGMEVVIIRPPLVYGPGVKANFAALIRFIRWGIPLPLAALSANRRSFVGIDNLISFIRTCIDHPAAAGQTFFVSDGDDLSTKTLIERLSKVMGRGGRLFNVPPVLLRLIFKAFARSSFFDRLTGTLQVDISRNQDLLGWKPPLSVDEGFFRMLKDDGAR